MTMKTPFFALTAILLLAAGCASPRSDARLTNSRQPGPALGEAVGTAVGAVAGNVAGAAVGAGEGFVQGAKAPFDNERRIIRVWKTEKTQDGRTIQVPVEYEVDANGRVIREVPSSSSN